jgi:acyl-CoA synthetase (AMP-forming)/AMP-acid ligase II
MLAAVVAFPEFERTDFSSIELLYWGGAAVPLHLAELVQRKEIRCGVIYGQSETTGIVTRGIAENGTTCEDASTTVGTPLDGIEWRLADPNTGFPGIRGRNLAFTPCNPLFLLSILPVFSQAFKWASFWPIYDVP